MINHDDRDETIPFDPDLIVGNPISVHIDKSGQYIKVEQGEMWVRVDRQDLGMFIEMLEVANMQQIFPAGQLPSVDVDEVMADLADVVENIRADRQDDLIMNTEDVREMFPGVPVFEIPRWREQDDD